MELRLQHALRLLPVRTQPVPARVDAGRDEPADAGALAPRSGARRSDPRSWLRRRRHRSHRRSDVSAKARAGHHGGSLAGRDGKRVEPQARSIPARTARARRLHGHGIPAGVDRRRDRDRKRVPRRRPRQAALRQGSGAASQAWRAARGRGRVPQEPGSAARSDFVAAERPAQSELRAASAPADRELCSSAHAMRVRGRAGRRHLVARRAVGHVPHRTSCRRS